MKIVNIVYYLFRRIFGKPIEYHIIVDMNDDEKYIETDKEFRCIHRDYLHLQNKSAQWRLTREHIVNGFKADAIKIIHSKTEYFNFFDISYFKPCLKA